MKGRGTKRASPLFLQIIRQQQKISFSSVATEWGTPRHLGGDDLQWQIKNLGVNIKAARNWGKRRTMERPAWGRSGRGPRSSSRCRIAIKSIQVLGGLAEGMGSQGRQRLGGGRRGAEAHMKYRGEDGRGGCGWGQRRAWWPGYTSAGAAGGLRRDGCEGKRLGRRLRDSEGDVSGIDGSVIN
jgi:hypothetical protein